MFINEYQRFLEDEDQPQQDIPMTGDIPDETQEELGEETVRLHDQKIFEGFLIDCINSGKLTEASDRVIAQYVEEGLLNEDMLSEKNVIKVKLDRATRTNIMLNRSILYLAKENNDPDYKRLVKVWQLRRKIMSKLTTKYKSKAQARARKLVAQGALLAKDMKEKNSLYKSAEMPDPQKKPQPKIAKVGTTGEKKAPTVKRALK